MTAAMKTYSLRQYLSVWTIIILVMVFFPHLDIGEGCFLITDILNSSYFGK